jgi:hypothetical protein
MWNLGSELEINTTQDRPAYADRYSGSASPHGGGGRDARQTP